MFTLTAGVNPEQLEAEILTAHGWRKRPGLSLRQPGQTDPAGKALPGALVVHRDDLDPVKVQAVVAAHKPDPLFGLSVEDRDLSDMRVKATRVLTDAKGGPFTGPETQRILAAAVLLLSR